MFFASLVFKFKCLPTKCVLLAFDTTLKKFELTFYFPGSRFRSWHLTHCSSTCLFIRITSSLSSKWSSSTCLLSLYLFIRITSHHNDPHQLACYPSSICSSNDPHQLTCYPCTCSLPTISWLCQPLKHLALNLCPDLLRHRIFLYIKSLCRDIRHKVFIVVVFDIQFYLLLSFTSNFSLLWSLTSLVFLPKNSDFGLVQLIEKLFLLSNWASIEI